MWGWLSRLLDRGDDSPDVATARVRAEQTLMGLDGVVSVGVGIDDDGHEQIVVGVEDAADAAVTQALPVEVDGVPLTVRREGKFRAEEVEGP